MDSGSDGDLLFMREGQHSIIPTKERFSPQKWKTSNGTFTTKNVGELELTFPDFSSSKVARFKPDIVMLIGKYDHFLTNHISYMTVLYSYVSLWKNV